MSDRKPLELWAPNAEKPHVSKRIGLEEELESCRQLLIQSQTALVDQAQINTMLADHHKHVNEDYTNFRLKLSEILGVEDILFSYRSERLQCDAVYQQLEYVLSHQSWWTKRKLQKMHKERKGKNAERIKESGRLKAILDSKASSENSSLYTTKKKVDMLERHLVRIGELIERSRR